MLHFCPISQIDISFGALRKKGAQHKKHPPNFPGSIDTAKLGNGYAAFGLLQNYSGSDYRSSGTSIMWIQFRIELLKLYS